ncbi:GGDEF domain-containing protein [Oribacterium sp. P6A1]|uniref:GGDEF domain-containing protein n=1 Tax=Oribacterium sp. P6A1 TaxID=1410612 RepID=UPI00068979C0|nr:GGDEF domain-containing protein [Oribacterium sp. P6A1]
MNIWHALSYIIHYANVWCMIAIVDSIFVITSTRQNHIMDKEVKKATYRTGALIIFAALVNMAVFYSYGIPELRYVVLFGYSIVYTVPMIVPIAYSDAVDPDYLKSKNGRAVSFITLIYVISMILNLIFPIYFSVNADGEYSEEILWYIRPVIMSYSYFSAFAEIIKKKYILSMGEIKTVNHIIVLFIIGVVYTDIFYIGEIIEMIMAAGFSFITSMFNNLEMKTDPVTRLANRILYTEDAFKYQDTSDLIVVSMDVNELKKVNDNCGHAAGDEYLKASALTYNKHLQAYGKLYRTGGDEFVFLGKNLEAVTKVIKKLVDQPMTDPEFGDFKLSTAFGIVEKQKDESVFDAVDRADKEMYECKRRMKEMAL